jgi:RecJ-like exonuclease
MTIEMKHKLIEAIVNDDKVGAIRILMDEPQDKLDRVMLENLKTEVSQLRAEVKDLKECFNTLGAKPKKVCARCGKEIGGNRKFCEECAKESQKEAKMKYYYKRKDLAAQVLEKEQESKDEALEDFSADLKDLAMELAEG